MLKRESLEIIEMLEVGLALDRGDSDNPFNRNTTYMTPIVIVFNQ